MSVDLQKLSAQLNDMANQRMSALQNIPIPSAQPMTVNLPQPVSTLGWLAQVNAQNQASQPQSNLANLNIIPNATATAPNATHEGLLGLLNQGFHDTGVPWLWNHLTGALQGFNSAPNDANYGNDAASLWGLLPPQLAGGIKGAVQGWENPAQAEQQFAQQNQQALSQVDNPVVKALGGFSQSMAGSPLTFVPGGVIAKPLGWAAKATGVTPAMKWLGDFVQGTVKSGVIPKVASPLENEIAQAAGAVAKPATTPEEAAAINEWAGLNGGYQEPIIPTVEKQVPTQLPTFAKPGAFKTTQSVANDQLTQLFNAAKNASLPAGRETEALQDLLGSLSGKAGVSLEKLIDTASTPQDVSALVDAAKAHTPGVLTGAISPQILQPAMKTITEELPQAENGFVMRGGPLAVIPQAAEDAKNAVTEAATHPYALNDWQAKVGAPMAKFLQSLAPNGVPVAKQVANAARGIFTTLPGTTQAFKALYSRYFGQRASGANEINNWLTKVFKSTSAEQRAQFIHLMESSPTGTKFADPKMEELRQLIEPRMQQAFEIAQKKGLIDKSLDLEKFKVQRYLPHLKANEYDKLGNQVSDGGLFLRNSVDANRDRENIGTIADLNRQHMASGGEAPLYETDAIKVLGNYFHQLNDAISAHDFKDAVVKNGLKTGETIHPETNTPVAPFAHNGQIARIPQAEANILNGLGTKADEGAISKFYRGVVNSLNKMMFLSNPLLHVVNNLGFQTAVHDPGAFKDVVKHLPEALNGINPGSEMDRALRAGALNLSSEIGARGGTAKQLDQVIKAAEGKQSVLTQWAKKYNKFTPDVEKAYRTAVFSRAVQNGMSEDEAAKYVRSIFGGHIAPNTMSHAERTLTALLPFGNWTKTALVSNAKNAVKNPAIYNAIGNAANSVNQQATGHSMFQNSNPAAIGIPGAKDAKGNQEYFEPYFPAWDLMKLGKEVGQQGIFNGLADFLFNRQNPLAKGIEEDLTGEQNPFASYMNKFPLMKQPILGPNAPINQQKFFFGNQGPTIPGLSYPYVAPFFQGITIPGAQTVYDTITGNGSDFVNNMINSLTGGTVTAPNPLSQLKEQQYLQSQLKSAQKKQLQYLAGLGG